MRKKTKDLNAANLKQELWETLQGIRSKKVTPTVANAVAKQSREIINIVKAELAVQKLNGGKSNAGTFLGIK